MEFALLVQRGFQLLNLRLFVEQGFIMKTIDFLIHCFVLPFFADELRKFVDFRPESGHKLIGLDFHIFFDGFFKLLLSVEKILIGVKG